MANLRNPSQRNLEAVYKPESGCARQHFHGPGTTSWVLVDKGGDIIWVNLEDPTTRSGEDVWLVRHARVDLSNVRDGLRKHSSLGHLKTDDVGGDRAPASGSLRSVSGVFVVRTTPWHHFKFAPRPRRVSSNL